MSDRDDSEAGPDSEDTAADEAENDEQAAASASAQAGADKARIAKTTRPSKSAGKSRRGAALATPTAASVPSSRATLFVVVALAAGAAGGWFGHIQQAKAAMARADAAPAPSGSGAAAGPCGAWELQICKSSGEKSAACQQAKAATDLLTASTCQVALQALPATLAKLKAGRASCEKLVGKLCTDLPAGSQTCDMVKDRTPSFPAARCDEMLKNYDKVIAELRSIDQQGGAQPGGAPMRPMRPMSSGGPGGPGAP
jgi:hypothetical protein